MLKRCRRWRGRAFAWYRLAALLLLLAAGVTKVQAAEPGAVGEGQVARPLNVLVIFCDDLATQAVSAYGHAARLLETPHIDRLARSGMLFRRCLVPNSICGPSRASVLTGKYSHLNGFYRNGNRFDGSQWTFPKVLQQAGYQTAVIGKWHLASDPTGFDHWHVLPDQGRYYNPPMIRNGEKVRHEGYATDLITDFSLEWLRQRDRSRPFLLCAWHKAPHREWAPALRHLGWNGERRFPEPATLFDDYAGRGVAERTQDMTIAQTMTRLDLKLDAPAELTAEQRAVWDRYYGPRNAEFEVAKLTGVELTRWRYQRYLHDYLGCVLAVDESVGRLLDYLDAEGLAESTLVILSSDQGFYLGEHGWFDKRWIYEESVTTPLLARWPGVTQAGSESAALVSVLDFPATVLEAAGAGAPADLQGRSLRPLLAGETPTDWRKSFYYHYYEYPAVHSVRKHYGVVTDRYKLFHFYEPDVDYWTLIDRQQDPQELRNVASEASYAAVRQELELEIARLRRELLVPDADPPESYPGRQRKRTR